MALFIYFNYSKSISFYQVLSAAQGKALKDDLETHKADNAAHNGFAGKAKLIPEGVTDFNAFTATGLYHDVLVGEMANEPITTASARRITLINMTASDGPAAMQTLIYVDGYHAGNIYFRHRQGSWKHVGAPL